ncbi:MAG: cohesin domain-containing protein [Bacteroidales bacterium]|nr:cohesin domain-containing protein [Bacteroidales bacterium]
MILFLQPIIMKSQNATATIGNVTSCAGDTVLAPVDVTNFIDVGAMTIYIGYDTNAAEFLSLQNINSAIPGGISYNASNGQLGIAYSNINSFTITSGKLFDLRFSFLGDSTLLPFNPGTEIANSNLEIIPLDTFPGSIKNSIRLISQPDSVKSYPDNDVIFRVTSLGNPDYQWQENTGSGWIDLQNDQTYSGVNNDTLTVHDVPLSYDGYTYRCVLSAGNCTEITDVALLEVALAFPAATLGLVSSCPANEVFEPLFVGDFLDVIEFTFNISFDTAYLAFQGLQNIHPDLLPGNLTTSPLPDPPGVVIHWNNSNPVSITSGKLFDLNFSYESQDHTLAFETGSEVLNSSFNPIDITLTDGHINQHAIPEITAQPQNDTVMEGQDVFFIVDALGTEEYIWQFSTDGGNSWTYLTDTPPYYNTHTAALTISPAIFGMNEYQFGCRLDNEYCMVYSVAATLVVDTLNYIGNPGGIGILQVHPVPFRDNIHISLPGDYHCTLVSVYDARGMMLCFFKINQNQGHSQDLELDLAALSEGLYFLRFEGTRDGKTAMEQRKILKTN